jgi:DNA-binding MarR family transcriptional regulator
MTGTQTTTSLTEDSEARITLGLLTAVQDGKASSQRSMASDLGIALGLTNAYVKRCVKKGFIKVRQIPRNRYAYYLTPQGFAEKSRLTGRFLSQSFGLFREAREQYAELFRLCGQRGWSRVVLYGTGSLSEIAGIFATADGITILGVVDSRAVAESGQSPNQVLRDTADGDVDAAVLTDLNDPQAAYDALAGVLPMERILVPPLLHVARHRQGD